jgi:hypothetical protein
MVQRSHLFFLTVSVSLGFDAPGAQLLLEGELEKVLIERELEEEVSKRLAMDGLWYNSRLTCSLADAS